MAQGAKAKKTILDVGAGGLVAEVSLSKGEKAYETPVPRLRAQGTLRRTELTPELYEVAVNTWRTLGNVEALARRLNIDSKTARKAVYGPMPLAWKGRTPLAKVVEQQREAMVQERLALEARKRKAQLVEIEGKREEREKLLRVEQQIGAGARKATAGAIGITLALYPAIHHLAQNVLPLIEAELKAGTLKASQAVRLIRDYIAAVTQLTQQHKNLIESRKIAESEPILEAAFAAGDTMVVTSPEDAEAVIALANKAIERAQAMRAGVETLMLAGQEDERTDAVARSAFAVRQGSADPRDAAAGNKGAGVAVATRTTVEEPDMDEDLETDGTNEDDVDELLRIAEEDPDGIETPNRTTSWGYAPPDRELVTERRKARGVIAAIRDEQEDPLGMED